MVRETETGSFRGMLVVHVDIITSDIRRHRRRAAKSQPSHQVAPSIFNMQGLALLVTCTTFRARPLGSFRNGIHVLLRSTGLERRLASLEMASVVLGPDEGEDKDVSSHDTDEDTLDEGVVRHVFGTFRSLNRCAGAISASCKTKNGMNKNRNNSTTEGDLRTGFDLSRSRRHHVTQLVSHTREGGPERRR